MARNHNGNLTDSCCFGDMMQYSYDAELNGEEIVNLEVYVETSGSGDFEWTDDPGVEEMAREIIWERYDRGEIR